MLLAKEYAKHHSKNGQRAERQVHYDLAYAAMESIIENPSMRSKLVYSGLSHLAEFDELNIDLDYYDGLLFSNTNLTPETLDYFKDKLNECAKLLEASYV